jgi:phosphoinositide-3-kinase regulatory subunit 4
MILVSTTEIPSSIVTTIETCPETSLTTTHNNRPAQRMAMITDSQQTLLTAHEDSITAVICIDSPFKAGIVSGDRAGVVKVWRVEGLEH